MASRGGGEVGVVWKYVVVQGVSGHMSWEVLISARGATFTIIVIRRGAWLNNGPITDAYIKIC